MKKVVLVAMTFATLLAGCSPINKSQEAAQTIETHVLHANDVESLTPDSVISILKIGNSGFIAKNMQNRDAMAQLIESAEDGQHPLAIVLSCIDSRVPVETIFDKGLGDLFVTRVAGHVVSPDVFGSMER